MGWYFSWNFVTRNASGVEGFVGVVVTIVVVLNLTIMD